MAESVTIHPSQPLEGRMVPPGDKSISHRVAMLAGLSSGESHVEGFLFSEDCLNTLGAMERLGATVRRDGEKLHIAGVSGLLRDPGGTLDLGNSGTGMRLMMGLLAGFPLEVAMTGDTSLCARPMRRISDPLERMGATIRLTGEKGTPPVAVKGGGLTGIDYTLPMASAQVKSAILLAGLRAEGIVRVHEPAPTRDHTEKAFSALGIPLETDGLDIVMPGGGPRGRSLPACDWVVPGDVSSAAFFIVAAAAAPGAEVVIERVGLNPRRIGLLDLLRRMGADIDMTREETGPGEPFGTLRVRGARLRAGRTDGAEIPSLIDELPLVAVAGALAEGTTVIRDAAELRVKESDRIAMMAENLRAFGVEVVESPDGMDIHGLAELEGGVTVPSGGDHRVAMAMSILALFCRKSVCIQDTDCVRTSYPEFWTDLKKLGGHVE